MTKTIRTQQGDSVDLIAFQQVKTTKKLTELILRANPGLAALGPILPEGVIITIPDLPPAKPNLTTRRLWT